MRAPTAGYLRAFHGTAQFVIGAILACFGAIAAFASTSQNAADVDFEAYQAAFNSWLEAADTVSEISIDRKTEALWKMEKAAKAEQAAALSFIEKYPRDPRRWVIVNKLQTFRPRYVTDWGPLSPAGKLLDIKIDTAAADAWKAKVVALRREMAAATDLPAEVKEEWANRVAAADQAKAQAQEFEAKWDGKPMAPDFTVVDPDGREIKLSDYRGKVVVLDFWATWCGPCMEAMPHNSEVARQYGDQDVVIICVCTMDTRPKFDAWVKKNGAKYPQLIWAFDGTATGGTAGISKLYSAPGLPTQFVIDRDGRVAGSVIGYGEGEVILEAKLARAGVKVDQNVLDLAQTQLAERRAADLAREKPVEELRKRLKK